MSLTVNPPLTTQGMIVTPQCAMAEFDCADDITAPTIVLIPANLNKNGLLIVAVNAVVMETFAGGSEDQGIVTISDESDNAIATVTAANAGIVADDWQTGSIADIWDLSEDAALGDRLVTAGEYVDAIVTQQTSSTPTGKMLVMVWYLPIPSKE